MNSWLERDSDTAYRDPATTPDNPYFATLDALDREVATLRGGLEDARTAPWFSRTRALNELHQRLRGMSLVLNDALGELAVHDPTAARRNPWHTVEN